MKYIICSLLATTCLASLSSPAFAGDEAPSTAATPAVAQTPTLMLPLTGPLTANPNPYYYDVPGVGKVYITGALSALAFTQSHPIATDDHSRADIDNAHLFVQKADGLVQFFVAAGLYSFPTVGTGYIRAENFTEKTFNYLPLAWLKFAPTADFSVMAGKIPSLFGAEYNFTFQNMNIERGLLWAQESGISNGVQANYTYGPLGFALAWTDGFYSEKYNWLSGSVTWTVDPHNSVSFVAGGNLDETTKTSLATPLAQNNSWIYNLIYTYNSGPWTITPYVQYTYVPDNADIGIADSASTLGAAVLAKYSFTDRFSVAGRVEYIDTNGDATSPNLLYGEDSSAWTATITPTYQYDRFFGRVEASYVHIHNLGAGLGFGDSGNDRSQVRAVAEVGVLF